jgi:hypothetical protein
MDVGRRTRCSLHADFCTDCEEINEVSTGAVPGAMFESFLVDPLAMIWHAGLTDRIPTRIDQTQSGTPTGIV